MIKAKIFECTGGYQQEEENLNKFLIDLQESDECVYISSIHVRKNSILVFYETDRMFDVPKIEFEEGAQCEPIEESKEYTIYDYAYTPATLIMEDTAEGVTVEY